MWLVPLRLPRSVDLSRQPRGSLVCKKKKVNLRPRRAGRSVARAYLREGKVVRNYITASIVRTYTNTHTHTHILILHVAHLIKLVPPRDRRNPGRI